MRQMKGLLAIATLAIGGALGAASADARGLGGGTYDWSGLYFGLHAGGAWADVDWRHVSAVPHFNPIGTDRDTFDPSGWLVGGHLGYNFQSGPLVFGIEFTASAPSLDQTYVRTGTFSDNTVSASIDTLVTVTGRLGWASGPLLIYASGGYAGADQKVSLTEEPIFDHSFAKSKWTNGWTVGGGLEYAFHPNISLGVAYSYIDLGRERVSGFDTSNYAVTALDIDTQVHVVTGRLTIKLGPAPAGPQPLK